MSVSIHKTTCVLDCPDSCALEDHVDQGRLVKLKGASQGHPNTQGFICGKVSRFDRRVYAECRLHHPMKRTGPKGSGSFAPISWQEAIDTITQRFRQITQQWGAEAILPYHYGGSNGLLSDDFTDALYFARLGASRLQKTICAAPTSAVLAGMYGKVPGVAFEDFVHARFILIWGANTKACNIHLVPYLKEARARGAFIVSVDPMNHFSAKEIDLHIGLRPGTDLPLALAIVRHLEEQQLLDRDFLSRHARNLDTLLEKARPWSLARAAATCRVEEQDLRRLIDEYVARAPALLRCGWGLERNTNGGQAAAAIMALPALLGKFGPRGGGLTASNSGVYKFNAAKLLNFEDHKTRLFNMTELADFLTEASDPPIKGLFVYNSNPVATSPDQNRLLRGMADEDLFTVVFDQVHTDSADYADIILPATTFLEGTDLRKAYGAYAAGGSVPVIDRVGESRTNHEVFSALGRSMGFDDDAFTWDDPTAMQKAAEALTLFDHPADPKMLARGEVKNLFPNGAPILFVDHMPATPDGKVELVPKTLGDAPYAYHDLEQQGFPLALISPASAKLVTSTFGEFNLPELFAILNPADAEARNISDGDMVAVYNPLGEVVCRVRINPRLCAGTICIPKGAWRKASANRMTSTALCPTTVNVVAGGACFNDARVEVRPHP